MALAAVGLLAVPQQAPAAVSTGTNQLVVSAPAASAVVTLDPFRISVRDSRGAAVLAEVPNTQPAPLV